MPYSARNAVAIVFAVNGMAIATWMSRIPHVRDLLGITAGDLGRMLLALAVGSLLALPSAGFVISKIGAARTVAGGSVIVGVGLVLAGIGSGAVDSVLLTAAGLAALGFGSGGWDVAMNVEGAAVERLIGRTIMPRFHAAFSLGTVVGAGVGAGATALGVTVVAHLVATGVLVTATTLVAVRNFLPRAVEADDDVERPADVSVWTAWREPRTLAVGVLVLSFALIEGIANDWLALGLVDGYDVSNAVGAGGFAIFVTAMTVGRVVGSNLIDRFGRLFVLRLTGSMATVGVLLVVFGSALPIAAVGIVIWGLGASLGFPLGMSAASDDPARAAARVSVVASIGYTAFLAGPPVLGWLGDHQGVLQALSVVAVAAVIGLLASPAARRVPAQTAQADPGRTRPVS
ncbi:MFS transporter [Haloactinopolyspora sp.]|uniref:MFS transporter n=1 Tax=Haloactinopolyspora sp. TaxID=1966353 RepID=UPI0026345881|nr:MFS transporter [Haloactinopolyspora sp.]